MPIAKLSGEFEQVVDGIPGRAGAVHEVVHHLRSQTTIAFFQLHFVGGAPVIVPRAGVRGSLIAALFAVYAHCISSSCCCVSMAMTFNRVYG
jgi:hypothetical protein